MSAQVFGRLVQSMTSIVIMLAVIAVSFVGVGQVDAKPQPKISLRFDRLDVVQEGSSLTVDYAINRNDWNAVQKANIEPRMDLYLPGQGRKSNLEHHAGYTLPRNSGKIVFQRVPENSRQNEVGIRIANAKSKNRNVALSFGRQQGEEIRVKVRVIEVSRPTQPSRPTRPSQPSRPSRPSHPPVEPERPHHEPHYPERPQHDHYPDRPHHEPHRPSRPHHDRADSQVDIINACKQNSTFSSDLDKCLSDAKQLRGHQTVAIINACGQRQNGLSECMRSATSLPEYEAVEIIRACGQRSTFSSDMKTCLDSTVGFRQEVTPVIQACGQASTFSSDFVTCMNITSSYRQPAAPIIRACKSASTFSSDFKKCLEHSR